ncbi:hypothetical protein BBF96_11220 [Anoxybacter fermentans]|uniref:Pyrrolo-quinoline quinone repeat domain-containing protein n=1 Tax=Anoxybacter fermentans TaxID=1323375 RepID=A0A3S9T079_9FIRM|nr:PQQ-binding-like beta-propeller repeat protein [Anoxybacter fermentans]AZR73910.1 hypothetical protein BBF96_11220 [Anoxybacter fermentans]
MIKKCKISLLITLVLVFIFTIFTFIVFSAEKVKTIRVEATGQAPLQSDRGLTKEMALKDAFRNALEQALGIRITAATVMENLTITSDLVISQTFGHLLSYEIINEWESEDKFFITISAEVSSDASWWAEFEGTMDVIRLHLKDPLLQESYTIPDQIQLGALYSDPLIVIPVKGKDYYILAIHAESNQIVWKKKLPDKLTTPLVTDGKWLIAITTNQVICINLQYGWIKWRHSLKEPVYQTPAISNETIYITTQKGSLLALDLKKGKLLWQNRTLSSFLTAPKVAGDYLYFADGDGYIHAFDLSIQSRLFKKLISPKLKVAPTPTRILTYLSWSDQYDRIAAINSVDGTIIWDFKGQPSSTNTLVLSPYLAQDKILSVFINSKESIIYLLDAKTGYQYWKQKLSVPVTEIAGVGNGLIILNTWRGIRILDLEHGSLLWSSKGSGLKTQLLASEDRLYYLHGQTLDIYH